MNEALHFDVAHVGRVYGAYTAGVYFLPLVGGLLADRVARLQPRDHRRRRADDGSATSCSASSRCRSSTPVSCCSRAAAGLLKPNVSTLVGNLYRDRPELRDQGFNIFYMGINLGAFISPLTVSWLRAHYGWSVGVHVGGRGDAALAHRLHRLQPARRRRGGEGRRTRRPKREAISAEDARSRVITLLAVFVISAVFWLAFYQIFYTFTFWARDNTLTDDRARNSSRSSSRSASFCSRRCSWPSGCGCSAATRNRRRR